MPQRIGTNINNLPQTQIPASRSVWCISWRNFVWHQSRRPRWEIATLSSVRVSSTASMIRRYLMHRVSYNNTCVKKNPEIQNTTGFPLSNQSYIGETKKKKERKKCIHQMKIHVLKYIQRF